MLPATESEAVGSQGTCHLAWPTSLNLLQRALLIHPRWLSADPSGSKASECGRNFPMFPELSLPSLRGSGGPSQGMQSWS